jgi:large subunit ribosomal protein L17
MRHRSNRLRLGQKPDHARLLKRNLVTALLLYESIRTTRKRARVIQPIVDNLITTAKTKSPHVAIRSINIMVSDSNASRKLMEVYTKRYAGRSSGFTRAVAVGSRKGDGAELVDLTLIDAELSSGKMETMEKSKKMTKKSSPSSKSSKSSK